MSLNDHLVAMSETQPWTSFALRGLNFQFLELNFQFLEGNFKMSEPCDRVVVILEHNNEHLKRPMVYMHPQCPDSSGMRSQISTD
jgi:hypothetical protein